MLLGVSWVIAQVDGGFVVHVLAVTIIQLLNFDFEALAAD